MTSKTHWHASFTVEERRRLQDAEQELLELKTMLVWGESDSQTPTFVRYRDFECLQQRLADLQRQLRGVLQQGLDPEGSQGLVAIEYRKMRGRVWQLQRTVDVLLLVLRYLHNDACTICHVASVAAHRQHCRVRWRCSAATTCCPWRRSC